MNPPMDSSWFNGFLTAIGQYISEIRRPDLRAGQLNRAIRVRSRLNSPLDHHLIVSASGGGLIGELDRLEIRWSQDPEELSLDCPLIFNEKTAVR